MNSEIINVDNQEDIEKRIFIARGVQVMLDGDVAELFGIETKNLNKAMKRNINRFPEDFCFQLNSNEFKNLRFQNATSSDSKYGGRRYLPYVYTEYGIIALAGVLKSEIAAQMSVEIARTFIAMRKFIVENGDVLLRLAQLQNRQISFEIETNKRFDEVIKLINKAELPKQVLFFEGQYYDAYDFISSLIRKATSSIVLVDPYCDNRALKFLSNRVDGVSLTISKSSKAKLSDEEINLFIEQYGDIEIIENNDFHDRFLIIDEEEAYSLGTSLNYAGKKTFVITKIEDKAVTMAVLKRAIDKDNEYVS